PAAADGRAGRSRQARQAAPVAPVAADWARSRAASPWLGREGCHGLVSGAAVPARGVSGPFRFGCKVHGTPDAPKRKVCTQTTCLHPIALTTTRPGGCVTLPGPPRCTLLRPA